MAKKLVFYSIQIKSEKHKVNCKLGEPFINFLQNKLKGRFKADIRYKVSTETEKNQEVLKAFITSH